MVVKTLRIEIRHFIQGRILAKNSSISTNFHARFDLVATSVFLLSGLNWTRFLAHVQRDFRVSCGYPFPSNYTEVYDNPSDWLVD
jgi:hypothetical protein